MSKSKFLTGENITNLLVFLVIVFVIALMLIVGEIDHKDQISQDKQYCEMVTIWEADRKLGIKTSERAGWPPFKGYCNGNSIE